MNEFIWRTLIPINYDKISSTKYQFEAISLIWKNSPIKI